MAHNPLDFTQPVGLLLAAVLHFIPDSDGPEQILATLCGQLSPGSYLAISHACRDTIPDIATVYETAYSSRVAARSTFRAAKRSPASSTGSLSWSLASSGSPNGGPTPLATSQKTPPHSGEWPAWAGTTLLRAEDELSGQRQRTPARCSVKFRFSP